MPVYLSVTSPTSSPGMASVLKTTVCSIPSTMPRKYSWLPTNSHFFPSVFTDWFCSGINNSRRLRDILGWIKTVPFQSQKPIHLTRNWFREGWSDLLLVHETWGLENSSRRILKSLVRGKSPGLPPGEWSGSRPEAMVGEAPGQMGTGWGWRSQSREGIESLIILLRLHSNPP